MKILAIININPDYPGGLLNATYERLIRYQKVHELEIINVNHTGGFLYNVIRKLVKPKFKVKKPLGKVHYKAIEYENLDFKYSFKQLILKLINKRRLYMNYAKALEAKSSEIKDVDLIYVHWGLPNIYIAYLLSLKHNIKYYSVLHGSDINLVKNNEQKYLCKALVNAENNFFVSKILIEKAKKYVAMFTNTARDNFQWSPNGINQLGNNIPYSKKPRNLGFIGSLNKKKGADRLVLVINQLFSLDPTINYLIIGKGPLKEYVLKNVNTRANIEYINYVEPIKMSEIYNRLKVVVVLSRSEGYPLVPIEAINHNCLVFGCNVGGMREIMHKDFLIDCDKSNFFELFVEKIKLNLDIDREQTLEDMIIKEENIFWDSIVAKEIKVIEKSAL